jgi:hypothetical protein
MCLSCVDDDDGIALFGRLTRKMLTRVLAPRPSKCSNVHDDIERRSEKKREYFYILILFLINCDVLV